MRKLLVKMMIWLLKHDFGAECRDADWVDFGAPQPYPLNGSGRCASCAASEVIFWLETHYLEAEDA